MSYVKIGVAGPVGSGKTALIECLTRQMASEYSIGSYKPMIFLHKGR